MKELLTTPLLKTRITELYSTQKMIFKQNNTYLNAGSDLKVGVAYTSWSRSPTHIQQNTTEYCQAWWSGISGERCA